MNEPAPWKKKDKLHSLLHEQNMDAHQANAQTVKASQVKHQLSAGAQVCAPRLPLVRGHWGAIRVVRTPPPPVEGQGSGPAAVCHGGGVPHPRRRRCRRWQAGEPPSPSA